MSVYFASLRTHFIYLVVALTLILAGCNQPVSLSLSQATQTPTPTPAATFLPSLTPSPLPSSTLTSTPTPTNSPTASPTPTTTATPTPSPTSILPLITVKEQANCRYGPGKAYLYAAGLYAGDTGVAGGRNYNGNWVWIKPDKLGRYCFAALSVLDVEKGRDIMRLPVSHWPLPHSDFYPPPKGWVLEGEIWCFRGYLSPKTPNFANSFSVRLRISLRPQMRQL